MYLTQETNKTHNGLFNFNKHIFKKLSFKVKNKKKINIFILTQVTMFNQLYSFQFLLPFVVCSSKEIKAYLEAK